jgi:hypothetical protein
MNQSTKARCPVAFSAVQVACICMTAADIVARALMVWGTVWSCALGTVIYASNWTMLGWSRRATTMLLAANFSLAMLTLCIHTVMRHRIFWVEVIKKLCDDRIVAEEQQKAADQRKKDEAERATAADAEAKAKLTDEVAESLQILRRLLNLGAAAGRPAQMVEAVRGAHSDFWVAPPIPR